MGGDGGSASVTLGAGSIGGFSVTGKAATALNGGAGGQVFVRGGLLLVQGGAGGAGAGANGGGGTGGSASFMF